MAVGQGRLYIVSNGGRSRPNRRTSAVVVRANPAEPETGIGTMTAIDTKWMAELVGRF